MNHIVVSGTIFGDDGVTPLEDVTLKVHHTDAEGLYNKKGELADKLRLRGTMVTGEDGFYEFKTIKPAPNPGGTSPAHIHAIVSGAGYPEQWIDPFWFEGDLFIPAHEKKKYADAGSFSPILKIHKTGDGLLIASGISGLSGGEQRSGSAADRAADRPPQPVVRPFHGRKPCHRDGSRGT